ncbi:MAG: MAPEG family protein [Pseudomonadales bacterium]|nr:MAPEG family protein [Pseudomonadales bacterium]
MQAHGNTIEFAPTLAILIYVLSATNPPVWMLCCMVMVTVSRYLI